MHSQDFRQEGRAITRGVVCYCMMQYGQDQLSLRWFLVQGAWSVPCCGQDGYRAQVPHHPIDTYRYLSNVQFTLFINPVYKNICPCKYPQLHDKCLFQLFAPQTDKKAWRNKKLMQNVLFLGGAEIILQHTILLLN